MRLIIKTKKKDSSFNIICQFHRFLLNSCALFLKLVKETFFAWNSDKAPRLAASLAFYTFFSLAPLMVIVTGIAGAVVGEAKVHQKIESFISAEINPKSARAINSMVNNFMKPTVGITATIAWLLVLFLTASGAFLELQDSLNTLWSIPSKGHPILNLIRYRLFSFSIIVAVGILMLSWLLFSGFLGQLQGQFRGRPWVLLFLRTASVLFSYGFLTLLFASIFKLLPETRITWGDVALGALITALLFNAGRHLLTLYLAKSSIASVYGALGSLAILQLWIYYSSQIFFFGAEFTKIFATRCGSCRGSTIPLVAIKA